jgi:hypothetical protein
MRRFAATICVLVLVAAACGDDGVGRGDLAAGDDNSGSPGGSAGSKTADIEPCDLFTDEELNSVLGVVPVGDESEPAGPFTGCSWNTGLVLVSIATSDTLILAPGQREDCPSAGIGEDSVNCPGSVKFLTNGIHASVSTIEDRTVTADQLLTLAGILEPKLED